jgi:tetratricopeptide (TPR) repeat protein
VSEQRALALALLEEALEGLIESDIGRRVRALSGIAAALYYVDHERERRVAHQAHELAVSCDDPSVKATAELALHRSLTHEPTAREDRLRICRSACELIEPASPTGELFLMLQRELLADLLESGNLAEFRAVLLDYEQSGERLGSPADIYWAMALRATEATLHGDLALAEQLARGAALRGYEFKQLSDGALLLQRFLIRYQQARLAEELPVLQQVYTASSVFRAGAALMATSLSESGRHERACEVAWHALGSDGSELARDVYWLAAIALFSGVAAQGQDRNLQQLTADLLRPCSEHVVVFGVGGAILGSGHYWLGLSTAATGSINEAIEHQRKALDVANEIEGPYWAAASQIELSRLLGMRGFANDKEEVAHLAEASLETARRFGFGRILTTFPDS